MISNRRAFIAGSCACLAGIAATQLIKPEARNWQVLCKLMDEVAMEGIGPLRKPPQEAQQALNAIADLVGMRRVFHLRVADFEKEWVAVAAVRHSTRYIVYDKKWFPIQDVGISWYMISIFAHEVGHHLYAHTTGVSESDHRNELDADRFGGWAVAKLGGSEAEALSFAPRLPEKASASHPGRAARIAALREGWRSVHAG